MLSLNSNREGNMYIVTKKFISGLLKGMTIKEKTSVTFQKGKIYRGIYSSSYIVLSIKEDN
jgi:hypothetical protein